MLTQQSTKRALKQLTIGTLFLGLAATAFADSGSLPVGSGVCSQQLQTTAVYIGGGTFPYPAATWTVQMQSTPTGAATEIYKAVLQQVNDITVKPPVPGTYYFRVCVTNTATKPVAYTYYAAGPHGSIVPLTGANTAVLGPNGGACAQFSQYGGTPAQRLGMSNAPVLWYMEEFDGDGNDLGPDQQVTAANINDTVKPSATLGAFYMELCVTNTSTSTAALTFQLVSN